MVQNGPWGALGAQGGAKGPKRDPKGRKREPKGSPNETKNGVWIKRLLQYVTFWTKNDPKMSPKKLRKKWWRKRRLQAPFWTILGAFLVAFWDQKWDRRRPWTDFPGKNDLCVSCSKTYTKMKIFVSRSEEKSILGGFGA